MNIQFNAALPSIKMSNGQEIPLLGFRVTKHNVEPLGLYNLLKLAIKQGYRHFDTAWLYDTDFILQKAINDSILESDKLLSREDFFIATKLWNNYHSKEMVRKTINETLTNFSMDYLDLFYIHWPMALAETTIQEPFPIDESGNLLFSDIHFIETYKEIEQSVDISNIGLCNFNMVYDF